jgi:hypothetical protein
MAPQEPQDLNKDWNVQQQSQWRGILAAAVEAQRLVPGAIAVGGTAAALHAHHRLSLDSDHLLPALRTSFDDVLHTLEQAPSWRTARVQPPVLILGRINNVQVGFRQARHSGEIESATIQTSSGPLRVPTLDEMIGMKAYMAYARNATRDYLDLAALASCTDEKGVVAALLKSDARYGHLQTSSVALEIAKRLSDPRPYDLSDLRLDDYKALAPQWQSWPAVAQSCRHLGRLLGEHLIREAP